jgi:hypothetical protein
MYVCMHVHIIYVHVYVYIHTYIYIYVYICIYTNVYIGGGGFMEEEEEEGVFRADAVNEGTPSATEPINNTLSVSPGCFAHPGPRSFWPGSLCKGGQLSEGRRA